MEWKQDHENCLLAGCGHVAMTSVLGLVVATIDGGIISQTGLVETHISSGILILLGFITFSLGYPIKTVAMTFSKTNYPKKATTTSLILMLTLFPLRGHYSYFLCSRQFWLQHSISAVNNRGFGNTHQHVCHNIPILAGYKRLRFTWLEKNEKATIGIVLLILGVFNILFG